MLTVVQLTSLDLSIAQDIKSSVDVDDEGNPHGIPLPSSWAQLTALTSLRLIFYEGCPTYPDWMSRLPLRSLILDMRCSGPMRPDFSFIPKLTRLEVLSLTVSEHHNPEGAVLVPWGLDTFLPDLGPLKQSLRLLRLSEMDSLLHLPNQISSLTNLEVLDLKGEREEGSREAGWGDN